MPKQRKILYDEAGRVYTATGRLLGRGVVCVRLPGGKYVPVCDLCCVVRPGD